MSTPLAIEGILAGVLEDVARRESRVVFQEIKALSRDAPPPRDALSPLRESGCAVIASITRYFPRRQRTVEISSIGMLARAFEDAGVHMVACQTEKLRYDGSLEDMWEARQAVNLPMMCRDVIVDPYQIHETRCWGADIVPLQVELLGQARLESLIDRVESLGMTVLAEVRTLEDADRALAAGAKVIGVNAWSLNSHDLDRNSFSEIVPGLPQDTVRVALGGVRTTKDLLSYAGAGADAVLVSDFILNADDPTSAARALVTAGQHPACPSR